MTMTISKYSNQHFRIWPILINSEWMKVININSSSPFTTALNCFCRISIKAYSWYGIWQRARNIFLFYATGILNKKLNNVTFKNFVYHIFIVIGKWTKLIHGSDVEILELGVVISGFGNERTRQENTYHEFEWMHLFQDRRKVSPEKPEFQPKSEISEVLIFWRPLNGIQKSGLQKIFLNLMFWEIKFLEFMFPNRGWALTFWNRMFLVVILPRLSWWVSRSDLQTTKIIPALIHPLIRAL